MAIPDYLRRNFDTLLSAAENGDLALMEGTDAATGQPRYILAAAQREPDGSVQFVPFGHLSSGNPYEEYLPPA
jgi:hypothetical protein